jgi:kynurenine formamidase
VNRRLVDLSHEIADGLVTYPGLPAPVISDWLTRAASTGRYAAGTEFQIGKVEMLANTATYIDAPFHRYASGPDVAGYALPQVADLEGLVVRAPAESGRAIDSHILRRRNCRGKAVLFHTGWDAHWGTDAYGKGHPFLTQEAVEYLVDARAALIGIDSLNIDDDKDGSRPAHTLLLAAGIAIVEHLCNLQSMPDAGFRFFAVPPRVRGIGSFPVRAFAILSD